MTENMQTNISPTTSSPLMNETLEKIMVAIGTIALVWIMVFLLVAMIEK
jgi:hypothetical protein